MRTSGIRELQLGDIAAAVLYAVDAPEHVNVTTLEILPTDQAVGGVKLPGKDFCIFGLHLGYRILYDPV